LTTSCATVQVKLRMIRLIGPIASDVENSEFELVETQPSQNRSPSSRARSRSRFPVSRSRPFGL
jgi:hypothetical protein